MSQNLSQESVAINPINGSAFSPRYFDLFEERQQLPVWKCKSRFLQLIKDNQIVFVEGCEGSGETTQVPQWCLEYARSTTSTSETDKKSPRICCTQPRRKAAIAAAQRVAEEMDLHLGEEVGFNIRFENRCCEKTILKYVTDGMLLREMMSGDRIMEDFNVIILDNAHERTLQTDILVGILKQVLEKRADLKLVIMSQTGHCEKLQQYFGNAAILTISTKDEHHSVKVKDHFVPEILCPNVNLVLAVLSLKKLGFGNLADFSFVDSPPQEPLEKSEKMLKQLGALDQEGNLTELGTKMADFPLEPQMSKMLILSCEAGCSNEIISIVAMLSVPGCFLSEAAKQNFVDTNDDDDRERLLLLNVFNAFVQNSQDPSWCSDKDVSCDNLNLVVQVRQQLSIIMDKLGLPQNSLNSKSPDFYNKIREILDSALQK